MNLNSVWQNFSDHLLHFIRTKVKQEEDAQDILQDVFVKVGDRLSSLKEEEKLQAWLFQITRNTITDYYRNKQKNQLDLTHFQLEEAPVDAALVNCIRNLIKRLPEKYRVVLELSEIEQISQKELAVRLNLSYSGTKSRVQRGREKLKELLLQCCDVEHDKYGNVIEFNPHKKCVAKCC